ncbi:molybdopterin-dependent oxidoreductase [Methanothermobacter marburgensis]|uniref:Formate dehydrogenase, alpha subunit n=2 Tax=Methanothermobacter marburgensis TaxID=145263 RepID=D9PY04_METTM|nr:molybdopterin-dependent oxidoreductase [Methanothermobacter marburgensis]ADL59102.1 formate dehydrogenase, alpha subunit [Methanothermobacter marburgensis str. Marburg]WBF09620.1 molybdopterin-dependent oxidoreductase [Methanothermobacter marburgensis]
MMVKHTLCPSCSAGCGVNIVEMGGAPVGTYPYRRHPVNEGKTCRAGRDCYEIPLMDRVTSPGVKKSGKLSGVNWDEALDKLTELLSSEDISILTTGTLTNEEALKLREIIENFNVKKSGLITVFPEFDYPEIDIRNIRDYDNIAVIGDAITCAPLIGRRIFHAMAAGAEVRSYDRRDETRMAVNSGFHITFSDEREVLNDLQQLPGGSLIIITPEIPEIIGPVLEFSSENEFDVLPIFEDFNTRGVMQHLPPVNEGEFDSVWLIDPGAAAEPVDVSGKFVLQSIRTEGLTPDIFLPVAAWCEKSGSYTSTAGYTMKLEPALQAPEGVLSDMEIFERILRAGD